MAVRLLALSMCAGWLLAAACTVPAPSAQPAGDTQAAASTTAASTTADSTPADSSAQTAPAAPTRDGVRLNVRTGGQLPPQVVPQIDAADRSCSRDADCTVKDIGGSHSACVNRDSATIAAAVPAQCAQQGTSSASTLPTCGAREASGCRCVEGACIALAPALDPPEDPAPQPDPVR